MVVGTAFLWFLDLLDNALTWLGDVATTPITLPAVLLVLLIAALLDLAWPHARSQYRRRRGLEDPSEVHLGANELKILQLYSGTGDERFGLETLQDIFSDTHPFRVERALDALVDAGLVEEPSAGSSTYWLTSMGKDLCLEIEDQYRRRQEAGRSEDDNPAE